MCQMRMMEDRGQGHYRDAGGHLGGHTPTVTNTLCREPASKQHVWRGCVRRRVYTAMLICIAEATIQCSVEKVESFTNDAKPTCKLKK